MNNNASATDEHPEETLAAITVSGSDRVEFLQGQLTQDITQLRPDNPLLAGWTNPKGRLLCVCWLLDWQDKIWLVMPRSLCATVANRLKMFVLRSEVSIEVSEICVSPAERVAAIEQIQIENNLTSYSFYNDNSFYFEPSAGTGLLLGQATPNRGLEDWRLKCIRAGLPSVWTQTRESFIPQMLNMDLLQGISFTKGCYVGQEIVARTQNLGKIKRRMYGFTCQQQTPVLPGENVYCAGKVVGEIVDAANAGDHQELLAVIRIESIADELSLDAEGANRLTRTELPYGVPEAI